MLINCKRFAFFAAMALLTIITSCKDGVDCYATCLNNGICNEIYCNCLPGYEGDNCGIISREKYLGSYTIGFGFDKCDSIIDIQMQGEINITADADSIDKVIIHFAAIVNGVAHPYPDLIGHASKGPLQIKYQSAGADKYHGYVHLHNDNVLAIDFDKGPAVNGDFCRIYFEADKQ